MMHGEGGNTRPTSTRGIVVVFAITLAVLQYIDRVAISQAAPLVMRDLALTKEQMSWVFSAFTLAYALFEIPGGYLGDWIGPRKVLLRIVLWWSFFTAATGWAWGLASLVITRFLFGAGEAGCFPNLTKAFKRWLPEAERSRAQGIMWMSARWGGAVTPLLVYACLTMMTWRQAFLVFGLAGVAWAVVFAWWYRDDPRTHPDVNAAEAAILPPPPPPGGDHLHVPWRRMATSLTVWCLCGQYAAMSYAWYFFVTWFPTYLLEVWKFDLKASAALAGLPLFLGGFGSLAAGWLTPLLARRIGIGRTRRWIGAGAMAAAAGLLVASTFATNPYVAVILIALVSFAMDLTMPGSWTTCMDIGGRATGTLGGTMNMMGQFGGFVSPIVLGLIVGRTGNWPLTFHVTAIVCLAGAACWLFIDPTTPLDSEQHHAD
jgi:ACS family glucarate transporter-like MFS transporter